MGEGTKAFSQVLLLFMLHVFPAAFKDVEMDLKCGGNDSDGAATCNFMVPQRCIPWRLNPAFTGVQPSPLLLRNAPPTR